MKEYKSNQKRDFRWFLITLTLLVGAILIPSRFSKIGWISVIFVVIAFPLFHVFSFRLVEIKLDQVGNRMGLIYRNVFRVKKIKWYEVQAIEFTYKWQAISLRSGVTHVCSFYCHDTFIAKLIAGNDGWEEYEISRLVRDLLDVGAKKKFVGYSLKDVEL